MEAIKELNESIEPKRVIKSKSEESEGKPKDNEMFYFEKGKKKVNTKFLHNEHKKIVKGIFRFHECPGAYIEFSFRETIHDKMQNYKFTDGEVCEIPLGVAIHLNKNCFYPQYNYIQGETTKDIMRATKKVRRVSFQSLEFIDLEELNPSNLISVEYASGL